MYFNKVCGTSLGPQPDWPCNRTFEEVDQLHEWNSEQSLRYCIANTGSLLNSIHPGKTLADLGCGDGTFAAMFKEGKPSIQVIAAGTHDLKRDNIEKIDRVYYGYIPQQTQLLDDFAGQCELVTETYGPLTYYDNPAQVLAYALYLLEPEGTYSCITSTTKSDEPRSVFGTREQYDVVRRFFIDKFGSNVSLIDTKIKSRVKKLDNGEQAIVDDFLLRLRFKGHNYVGVGDYERLCQDIEDELGEPVIDREHAWFSADRNFTITPKVYSGNRDEDAESVEGRREIKF